MRFPRQGRGRLTKASAVAAAAFLTTGGTLALAAGPASATSGSNLGGLSAADGYTTTANLSAGSIQHVWLIILENKSYNSEFTGVNDDTYLWQTLPSEGALLENYHGTGHTSMDNYITLASGQAPQYDVQSDCSDADTQFASNNPVTASQTSSGVYNGGLDGIVNSGSVGGDAQNWFLGQAVSALGPNAPIGSTTATNGCTYPSEVATLFDQFNQAGVTWKGYAQDLGGAQQIGSTSFVSAGSGATANEPASWSGTVPGRDAGTCAAPGNPDTSSNSPSGQAENPVSNPTFLSGSEGYPTAGTAVSSTVTSATTTAITDSSQTFSTSLVGDEVLITSGAAANEYGKVASVSGDTITLSGSGLSKAPGAAAAVAPSTGDSYVVGVQDTSSYTGASQEVGTGTGPDGQAYSSSNPEYEDQYVAKHFPFGWFESLSGVGGGGTTALTKPVATTEDPNPTNCDAEHIANLDSPTYGLEADLASNTAPNFSWITPDNCSDGHDASCQGNNLSGAFGTNLDGTVNLNDPIYSPATTTGANCTPSCSGLQSYDPEATTPRNFTGGTYAADLFLAYYVPLIEKSAAFQHGLIDVTFDEGEPSFVYGGNTFNNIPTTGPTSANSGNCSTTSPPSSQYDSSGGCYPTAGTGTSGPSSSATGPEDTKYPSSISINPSENLSYGTGSANPGATSQFGADSLFADSAGESFDNSGTVTNSGSEPTGPNSPLATDSNGNQLYYGPGFNLDIDRPAPCAANVATGTNGCVSGEALGDGGTTSAATRTDSVSGSGTSVTDNSINADDTGREIVSATVGGNTVGVGTTAYDTAFGISSGDAVFVGDVTESQTLPATSSSSKVYSGAFQLTDDAGNAVTPTGALTNVTLSGECDPATSTGLPSTCSADQTPDPLFDASDPTNGGGDTGSVLISPYINPDTVSTVDYNHYDWLRTMEDLFDVNSCSTTGNVTLTAGTVCGGEDGLGHLGYAAQTNLNDFGADVFTNPSGQPPTQTPESPLAIVIPLAGIVVLGGLAWRRSRRIRGAASL